MARRFQDDICKWLLTNDRPLLTVDAHVGLQALSLPLTLMTMVTPILGLMIALRLSIVASVRPITQMLLLFTTFVRATGNRGGACGKFDLLVFVSSTFAVAPSAVNTALFCTYVTNTGKTMT